MAGDSVGRGSGTRQSARSISLKARALRMLSMREHSRAELVRKLHPYNEQGEDLDALLDGLEAQGWLSDERAAQGLVRRSIQRLGIARVRQVLQTKGLAPEVVAHALADLNDTEEARAWNVWQRKFGHMPTDVHEQAKHTRFMLARGFSSTVIRRVFKRASQVPDDGHPLSTEGGD